MRSDFAVFVDYASFGRSKKEGGGFVAGENPDCLMIGLTFKFIILTN